jgi:hypothetical protein
MGAGMMMRATPKPIFNAAETGWAKLILEFGLVGSITYFSFLYTCIFRSNQPMVLRVALAVMTLLSGILDSPVHGLIIPLLIWLAPSRPAAVAQTEEREPGVSLALRPVVGAAEGSARNVQAGHTV